MNLWKMRDAAYDAFYESVEDADSDPVRFQFNETEVERFDIPKKFDDGSHMPVWGNEVICNLSERGYPYIRTALIFEVMSERLK